MDSAGQASSYDTLGLGLPSSAVCWTIGFLNMFSTCDVAGGGEQVSELNEGVRANERMSELNDRETNEQVSELNGGVRELTSE